MHGQYCNQCGEQRVSAELRSVKYILRDLFTEFTSVDGKLWKTLRTLFFKPGQLDYDYHIGKRINYIKPITLFLLFNVLFVMFSPITDFYLSFYDQLDHQTYSSFTKPLVLEYIAEQQASVKSYAQAYNQLVPVLARSLIILQVPVFAFLVSLICWQKNKFSGDYLIFGFNYNSWLLVWIVFLQIPAYAIGFFGELIFDKDASFPVFAILLPAGLLTYLWFSAKKLFQFSFWQILWRMPLLTGAVLLSHLSFRFFQMVITLALIKV